MLKEVILHDCIPLQKSRHVNNQFNRNCDSEMGDKSCICYSNKHVFYSGTALDITLNTVPLNAVKNMSFVLIIVILFSYE